MHQTNRQKLNQFYVRRIVVGCGLVEILTNFRSDFPQITRVWIPESILQVGSGEGKKIAKLDLISFEIGKTLDTN
jgi:hypothetical protein